MIDALIKTQNETDFKVNSINNNNVRDIIQQIPNNGKLSSRYRIIYTLSHNLYHKNNLLIFMDYPKIALYIYTEWERETERL